METSHEEKLPFPFFSLLLTLLAASALGLVIGFCYLATIPPKLVRDVELRQGKEDNPNRILKTFFSQVTYTQPAFNGVSRGDLDKRFLTSREKQIAVTAPDLNAWAARNIVFEKSRNSEKEPKEGSVFIHPQTPEFFISDQLLYINCPIKVNAASKELSAKLLFNGDFNNTTGAPKWETQQLFINSAPVPFPKKCFKLLEPKFIESLSSKQEFQNMQKIWDKIESITTQDGMLICSRK